jgi:hypothetical protein
MLALDLDRPAYHIPVTGILIIVLLVVVGTTYSHAVTKHGEDAIRVQNCMDTKGPMQVWHNPETNHVINVCEVEPGLFGLDVWALIDGKWERITSFLKNKMSKPEQIWNYLTNSGARRVR